MSGKGFVHIVEVVIVSLMAVLSVPFLLNPLKGDVDWADARLAVAGKDILETLDNINDGGESYLQNIMSKNASEITSKIDEIMGPRRTMGFGMRTFGAYKNIIRVGFNCTSCVSEDVSGEIATHLTPADVNGRNITFSVFPFQYENIDRLDVDVILIYNNPSQHEPFESRVRNHLSRGRGVVEFSDLSGANAFQQGIFSLSPGGPPVTGGNQTFVNNDSVAKQGYEIQKIYYGVSDQQRVHHFNSTESAWINSLVTAPQEKIAVQESNGKAGMVLNATGRGRAAWLDYADSDNDDVRNLLKSAVIWSAPKDWYNIQRAVNTEMERVTYAVSQGEEFHEPYYVEMNLWYLF